MESSLDGLNITFEKAEESVNSEEIKRNYLTWRTIRKKSVGQCNWSSTIREKRGWDRKNI